MIIDRLARSTSYRGLSSDFARGFDFLQSFDANLPDGRYEIMPGRIHATVASYLTKVPSDAKQEAHRLHADIQWLMTGEETFLFTPFEQLGNGLGYVPEKDYEHFPTPQAPLKLPLLAGQFVIFFPGEGHRTNCVLNAPTNSRKIVVKVRV